MSSPPVTASPVVVSGTDDVRTRRHLGVKIWLGGGGLLLAFILAFVVAPLAHMNPTAIDPLHVLTPPSPAHPFGTDDFGRDVMARVFRGAGTTLGVGLLISIGTFLIGFPIGLLTVRSKLLDAVAMRVADAFMSLPAILIAIALMAVVGPGLVNVIIVLLVVWTPLTVRVSRAAAFEVMSKTYVEAAESTGVSFWRLFVRHIAPNALDAVIVQQTVAFAGAMLGEATFSFVGVGIQPPTPSLGNILAEAQQNLYQAPWMAIYPAIALATLVLMAMLLGDGLRDFVSSERD